MDDRVAIDVVDTGHDALLELLLRPNPDVAQDRAGELGEEALDEVEPGAVLGCEGELETAGRSSGQPSFGFSRGVRVLGATSIVSLASPPKAEAPLRPSWCRLSFAG
jgi:hypothetical protein